MEVPWGECPFGNINDPYPGSCYRYTDSDGDLICDRSQSPPEERSILASTDTSNLVYNPNMTYLWGLYIPIAVYFIYWYVMKKANLKKKYAFFTEKYFRLFWNVVLFLSFFVSAVTAIIQLYFPGYLASEIHKNSGLVMMVVAVLHIFVRRTFFQGFLKSLQKK